MCSVSTPFLLLTLAVGAVLSLTPYGYHSSFGYRSGEKPFRTLRNMPVQTCVTQCQLRNACKAVNYWIQRRDCEMLLTDEGSLIQQDASKNVTIFIKKSDVQSLTSMQPLKCQSCDDKTVCDIDSGDCVFKACPDPPPIANAEVDMGTRAVGDVRYYTCDAGFIDPHANLTVLGNDSSNSSIQCQDNGTWTYSEFQCVADTVCPHDLLAFHNAVLQDGTVIRFRAFFDDASIDFNGAKAKCATDGGSLYQILTLAKMKFTLQLMACPDYQSRNFWINGAYNQSSNMWETTAGTQLPMDFWYPGMPNDKIGDTPLCVWLYSDFGCKWDDRPCTFKDIYPTYALCELF